MRITHDACKFTQEQFALEMHDLKAITFGGVGVASLLPRVFGQLGNIEDKMGRDLNAVKNENSMNWNNHFHHKTDKHWNKLKSMKPPKDNSSFGQADNA